MTERCDSCRFWDPCEIQTKAKIGDCRRDPPRFSETILHRIMPSYGCDQMEDVEAQLYLASVYPVTHDSGWCGRFEPKALAS